MRNPYLWVLLHLFSAAAWVCEGLQCSSLSAALSAHGGAFGAAARGRSPAGRNAALAQAGPWGPQRFTPAFAAAARPQQRHRRWLSQPSEDQRRVAGHPLTGFQQQHQGVQQQRSSKPRLLQTIGRGPERPHYARARLGLGALQMNAAPPGSALERQMKELMQDPVKNMPWDIYVPFYKQYGRGTDNNWLHFLQGNWTFIESKTFAEMPVGVIDGGPEAYKGEGTSLPHNPLSIDRQHAVKWPQHYAHGVGYREATDKPHNIRLDRLPDGNQDVYFGETDAELDARLWGSWDNPQALHEYFPETGWRDTLQDEDITGMPRPWTHKQSDILELPPHHRDPSPGPPEIPLEVELAAAGMWGGYVLEPGWTRHGDAIAEYRKAQEWAAAEAPPEKKKSLRKTKASAKKAEKQQETEVIKRMQEIVKAHWADIRKHPVYVRAVVDGATHASAVAAAAAATPKTAAEMAMGEDITKGLEMQEAPSHLVRGEVNPPDAEGKTMAVNLALYSLSPYNCSYLSPKASIAEHEELYHYLMTENHREGRYTDFNTEIAAIQDTEYRLRPRREDFPRLMAFYKPLWMKRKYGEEFGGPLGPDEEVDEDSFTIPGESLRWTRRSTRGTRDTPNPQRPPLHSTGKNKEPTRS